MCVTVVWWLITSVLTVSFVPVCNTYMYILYTHSAQSFTCAAHIRYPMNVCIWVETNYNNTALAKTMRIRFELLMDMDDTNTLSLSLWPHCYSRFMDWKIDWIANLHSLKIELVDDWISEWFLCASKHSLLTVYICARPQVSLAAIKTAHVCLGERLPYIYI